MREEGNGETEKMEGTTWMTGTMRRVVDEGNEKRGDRNGKRWLFTSLFGVKPRSGEILVARGGAPGKEMRGGHRPRYYIDKGNSRISDGMCKF